MEQETIDSVIRPKLVTEHRAFKKAIRKQIDHDESQHSNSEEDDDTKTEEAQDTVENQSDYD